MKQISIFSLIFISISTIIVVGCTNRNRQDIVKNIGSCDSLNTKFAANIYPLIHTHCNTQSGCHGTAPLGSISLEGYQDVKDNISEIITRINSGNMPKNQPKLDPCSIYKIEKWNTNGALNN